MMSRVLFGTLQEDQTVNWNSMVVHVTDGAGLNGAIVGNNKLYYAME